uniref:Uncharacterized protein n=1 Tax=viral metagenome TaxID=1070528 RepID=A0A6H1ZYH6_9ZZZZ
MELEEFEATIWFDEAGMIKWALPSAFSPHRPFGLWKLERTWALFLCDETGEYHKVYFPEGRPPKLLLKEYRRLGFLPA